MEFEGTQTLLLIARVVSRSHWSSVAAIRATGNGRETITSSEKVANFTYPGFPSSDTNSYFSSRWNCL